MPHQMNSQATDAALRQRSVYVRIREAQRVEWEALIHFGHLDFTAVVGDLHANFVLASRGIAVKDYVGEDLFEGDVEIKLGFLRQTVSRPELIEKAVQSLQLRQIVPHLNGRL